MGDRWTAGIVKEEILQHADLVEILAYTADPQGVASSIQATHLVDPQALVVGLQAYYPCATNQEMLSAQVKIGQENGVSQFSFYNFGIMPRPNLQWAKHCKKSSSGTG
jgi:hypothetical protein